jgi:hypothetical protein
MYNDRHWLTDVAAAGMVFYVPKGLMVVSKMQTSFFKRKIS